MKLRDDPFHSRFTLLLDSNFFVGCAFDRSRPTGRSGWDAGMVMDDAIEATGASFSIVCDATSWPDADGGCCDPKQHGISAATWED